ncbi:hypothetical protein, partial [Thermococcus sp.]
GGSLMRVDRFFAQIREKGLEETYEWFEYCMAKAGWKRKRGVVAEEHAGAEMWESIAWDAIEQLKNNGVDVDDEILSWLKQRAEEIKRTVRGPGQYTLDAFLREVRA